MLSNITSKKVQTYHSHSLRLSRINTELSTLLSELHSYRCEPCTPDMHEQYLKLNADGQQLIYALERIMSYINESIRFSEEIEDEVHKLIKQYHLFQKDLSSYLKEAVVHH